MTENAHPGIKDYGLMLVLAAIWGSSFTLIKIAVETAPVLTITSGRMLVATVILYLAARLAGQSLPYGLRIWTIIFVAGLFGNLLPFTLIGWGEKVVDSSLTAILMGLMPLVTVILAHFFTPDEKSNWYKWIGVLCGMVGLVILIGPANLTSMGSQVVGQLAILAAAACYSINALITKSLMYLPRRALAAAIMLAATVAVLPLSLVIDKPWSHDISGEAIIAIIALGIFQTAIATLMMFVLIRNQGATFFSQINYLVPVFGVLWGAWLLAERPGLNAYIAMGLILVGLAAVRMGTRKPIIRPPTV
ncbi:MAG: DMT family transporter [Fimbriimonadaceae bacterium]|nr:DMT family transporter [Alphaproteobacteria bacterium]